MQAGGVVNAIIMHSETWENIKGQLSPGELVCTLNPVEVTFYNIPVIRSEDVEQTNLIFI